MAESWVEITTNPAHKRSGFVCLTKAGRSALEHSFGQEAKLIETLKAELPDLNPQSTVNLLRRVRHLLLGVERPRASATSASASNSGSAVEQREGPKLKARRRPKRTPSTAPAERQKRGTDADEPTELPVSLL